jgi:hypothetical protein
MLGRIASNGLCCILVDTANRFARDFVVQETGWRFLQAKGIPTPRPPSWCARCWAL